MDVGMELSFVCFAFLLALLIECVCMLAVAVGLVLRNAADAVQLSNMMRSLPQSVVKRNLLIPISLFLWPRYPLIASSTLDGILGMDGNYVSA